MHLPKEDAVRLFLAGRLLHRPLSMEVAPPVRVASSSVALGPRSAPKPMAATEWVPCENQLLMRLTPCGFVVNARPLVLSWGEEAFAVSGKLLMEFACAPFDVEFSVEGTTPKL